MTATDRFHGIYAHAAYRVDDPGGSPIDITIGEPSAALAGLLTRERVTSAVMITAHNPRGEIAGVAENEAADAALAARIDALGLGRIPAVFGDHGGDWPDEPGWLVLGLDMTGGIALGRVFDQNAVVGIDADGLPLLGWCRPEAAQNVE